MRVLRSTVLVDAAPRTVAGLVRDMEVVAEAGRRAGLRVSAERRLLTVGDEVRVGDRLRMVVRRVDVHGMCAVLWSGPELRYTVDLTPAGAGTRVDVALVWAAPPDTADPARWLAAHAAVLVERAAVLGPVVVATALVRDGRVLVAQRRRPPALAGRWELPGGRVEAGESEPDAVARECREELAVAVRATGRLGTDLPLDAGVLRVHVAELLPGEPEPRALEHAALCWVGGAELDAVGWVDADRAVVADLRALLDGPPAGAAEPG